MKPQQPSPPPPSPPPRPQNEYSKPTPQKRDTLVRIETYLAKRDGVDKLLKISRYATKLILASSTASTMPGLIRGRLESFESSVGLSRKAFRLGKFIQDVNSLRSTLSNVKSSHPRIILILALVSYGGEGVYYFLEQFVWLSKSGLINAGLSRRLQIYSAWSEFVGYIGSISLKLHDLSLLNRNLACLAARGDTCDEQNCEVQVLKEKVLLKRLSIVQDLADAFMALADIRDSKKGGYLSSPLFLSCAGLLSALISTHKNWVSC
ncbi:hypothetical protein vseg_018728 [Gypsophila vaccaria]